MYEMLRSTLIIVVVGGFAVVTTLEAQEPNQSQKTKASAKIVPQLKWCEDHFCDIDIFGDAEACCYCPAFFNESSCCYNETCCRCVETYGPGQLWCDTSCPCDLCDIEQCDAGSEKWQLLPTWHLRPNEIPEVVRLEVTNSPADLRVSMAKARVAQLQETVTTTLGCYFANDARPYLTTATQRGETMPTAKRKKLILGLEAAGALRATDKERRSDAELIQLAWKLGSPNRPWLGLAEGESRLVVFRASNAVELEAQSLRRELPELPGRGSTTWRPVYQSVTSPAAATRISGIFAEFLVYVEQDDSGTLVVFPYVLRLRCDDAAGQWRPVSLWTPVGRPPAKLIF